jgi:hypothetical protein
MLFDQLSEWLWIRWPSVLEWALNVLILRLFNNTVPTADDIFSLIRLKNCYEWRANLNLEKGNRALFQGTILAFCCRDCETLQNTV